LLNYSNYFLLILCVLFLYWYFTN